MNFHDLSYLNSGTQRQKAAYVTLNQFSIFEKLASFKPFLAGTIPIGIDIETSDLDILCCFAETDEFHVCLEDHFRHYDHFTIQHVTLHSHYTIVANFVVNNFPIEIFGQKRPVELQEAYRHMAVEYALLKYYGDRLRRKVISLKKKGIKTEPAFVQALGIDGDPYQEMLELKIVYNPKSIKRSFD